MKSILLGVAGAAVIAIVAIAFFDYGGAPAEERFSAPNSVRLD